MLSRRIRLLALVATIALLTAATATVAQRRRTLQPSPMLTGPVGNNATSADVTSPSPHRINEVSMLVSSLLIRRFWEPRLLCAYMAYPTGTEHPYTVKVAVGYVSSTTTWTNETPPLPAGLTDGGDPVLASNPVDAGFHPMRIYLAARAWDNNSGNDEIMVWHRNVTAPYWVTEAEIAYNSDSGVAVDNPAVAVSQYGPTLGHAYLAYLEKGATHKIHFYRNAGTDTWTEVQPFGQPVYSAPSGTSLNSLRLDVDPGSGTIYLTWVDWTAGRIKVMTSSDGGTNWSGPVQNNQATFVKGGEWVVNYPNGYLSPTFVSTAFNTYDQSLAVVYHRRKAATPDDSEVVMEKFQFGAFSGAQPVSGYTAHSQWQGAVDCSSADGKCLVSYYDHDPGEMSYSKYKVYSRLMNPDGTPVSPASDVPLYDLSDASSFLTNRMEYHDVFYYNGQWLSSNVISPPGQNTSDVWVVFQ